MVAAAAGAGDDGAVVADDGDGVVVDADEVEAGNDDS
jgi:hypothetical protein